MFDKGGVIGLGTGGGWGLGLGFFFGLSMFSICFRRHWLYRRLHTRKKILYTTILINEFV